ncbi:MULTISPECIES: hypothetical protein [Corallococcus]|uniref:hypothetical protein n=1 Tax=Corallococcus TaxID=83461 RepID=UPI0011815022|nr:MULTISPECIES: hypothetical protein [Corallococcus]NBD10729.1 hypothetical protein [Corallococcus silvisoli]TSC31816.1 hypothetical protein FOF48_14350 [Corallococcus sp. Z5C101001]
MEINPQQMADRARQLQDQVLPNVDDARQNLVDLNRQVVGFIKANPGTCLLGAIAVGFIVGRIASR